MDLFQPNEPVLVNRDTYERSSPVPAMRIRQLTPDFAVLDSRSTGDSGSNTSSGTNSTPIIIGVVVPVLIVVIILAVVLRRRQKITRMERANDKYRSLDFGVDDGPMRETKGRKTKAVPDVTISELKGSLRKDRGLSLDLGSTNPYLLPPELQSSRESLRSLSNITGDDKYRATTFIPDDGSLRSPSSLRSHGDGSSIFTASTRHRTGTMDTDVRADLLPRLPPKRDLSETPSMRKPMPALGRSQAGLLTPNHDFDRNSTLSTSSRDVHVAALRASNNYLGQYISGGQEKVAPKKDEQPGLILSDMEGQVTPPTDGALRAPPAARILHELPSRHQSSIYNNDVAELGGHDVEPQPSAHDQVTLPQTQPPSHQQQHSTSHEMSDTSTSQFPQRQKSLHKPDQVNESAHSSNGNIYSMPELPTATQNHQNHQQQQEEEADPSHDDGAEDYYDDDNDGEGFNEYNDYVDYTYRGSVVGVRPLPPDDPAENPEERAIRIRSFYKEYFEEGANPSKTRTDYYDGSEQYEQHDDFDYGYYEESHSRGPSIRSDGRHRAFSHGTHGYHPQSQRAYSSMSGRLGPGPRPGPGPRGRPPAKKQLPPPKPLMMLPTPGKLKGYDDFLPNAIDFAPPQVFRNQRSGTPDSGRGGMRPYSPTVRAHVPLASSYDDLMVMPSPHSLSKTTTFTGLDFAPPRRFKENGEAMSDAGSIRSNGSNLSKTQIANIRNGAYRVSRIPKEVAGTRDDMFTALKPKWDMRGDSMGSVR